MNTTLKARQAMRWPLIALMLGLLMLAGCARGGAVQDNLAPSHAGNFVGELDDTDAFVALVVDEENHVLAYVCDGDEEASTDPKLAEWFAGAVAEDGSLALTSADGATLSADVARRATRGTFTLSGKEHAFSAELVRGDEAGLYRKAKMVQGEEYVGGWILLDSGASRGAIRNTATGTVKFNSAGFAGSGVDLSRPGGPVSGSTSNLFEIEDF